MLNSHNQTYTVKGQKAGQKGVSKRPSRKKPGPENGNRSESVPIPGADAQPIPDISPTPATLQSDPFAAEAGGALSWLAAIVQSSDDAIISMDIAGNITSWNAAAEKIYGYSPAEVIGRHVSVLIPEDRLSEEDEILDRVRRGEHTQHYETIRRRKDGIDLHVSVSVSPILDSEGNIIGASKIARDFTEQKLTEVSLDQNRLMLSLAMQSSRMGAWERDFATGIVWWSEELENIFGLKTGTFSETENEFYDLIHEDDRTAVWTEVENAVSEKRGYIVEFRFRHADGTWRWMEGRGEAVYSQKGEPVRLYGVGIDITERKLSERKSRFLAALDQGLQATSDPGDAMNTASRMIGEHLEADRCVYCEVENEKVFIVIGDYTNGVPSVVGRWEVASFGYACAEAMHANQPFVVFDVDADTRIRAEDLPPFRASMTSSLICVPLYKNETFTAAIAVHHASPRVWTDSEIEVLQLAVNRCWESLERLRMLRSLRESDERFRLSLASGAVTVYEQDTDLGYKWVYPEGPYGADIIGKTDIELSPGPYGEFLTTLKRRVLETGTAVREEVQTSVLGKQKWFDLLVEPRLDVAGRVIGVGGTALEITDRKIAEIELATAAERLNVAVSAADLGDWSWSIDTDAVDFSERAAEIFGIAPGSNMTFTEMQSLIHEDDRKRVRREVEISVEHSGRYDVEYRVIRPGGELVWVAAFGQTMYDAADCPLGMFGVVQDITARKLADESIRQSARQLELVTNTAPVYICYCDTEGRFKFVNKAYAARFGLKPEECVGKQIEEVVGPEAHAIFIRYIDTVLSGRMVELEIEVPYGSIGNRFMHCSYAPEFDGNGNVVGYVGALTDITQRRKIEEDVRRANERFRIAEQASKGFVYELDLETDTVSRSEGFAQVLGYEIGEMSDSGDSWLQIIHKDDLAPLKERLDRAIDDGAERVVTEYRVRHKNGSYIWILDECAVIRDRDERPVRLIGSAVDITKRKKAEARLNLLSEISEMSRTIADPGDLMYEVSKAVGEHFQVRRCLFNEIDLESDTETVHRDYCEGVASVIGTHSISSYSRVTTADMIAGITVINNDSRIDPRTAADYETTYKPAQERSYITVPLLREGRWVASLWISDDQPREWSKREISLLETIAERTWTAVEKLRIDADLRESQSHLQITTQAAKVGTWRWNLKDRDLVWSDIHKDLWGYNPDQKVTYDDWLSTIDSHDLPTVEDAIHRSLTSSENYDVEYRIHRLDTGEARWIRSTGKAEFGASGNALSMQGVSIDITERKLAESILQRQARLIDLSYEPILVWSETEGIIEWNTGSEQLYGFTRDEAIGQQSHSLLKTRHPVSLEEFLSALEKNGEWTGEAEQTTKDGRTLIVESRQQLIELEGIRLVLETNRDITLRRESETLLQRYQLLSEHTRDMIWLLRPDGQIVEANRAAIDAYGYTREELLQLNVKQLRHESTFATFDGQLRDATLGNVHFETLHVRKDGTAFPVEVTASSAEIGGERYLMSIVRDITERKNAETVLRESEERFAKAFNASPLVVTITSLRTGRLTEVNQTFVDVTGIPREEAIGKTTAELGLWEPEDRENELLTLQGEGSIRNREYVFRVRGDSKEIVGLLSAEMLDIGGEPSALTVIQDVTERKRSEESLRQSEKRLQQLADAMPQVVWVADPEGNVTYYNHRVSEFYGIGKDEHGHWNWQPCVHPDDLEATSSAWKTAVDQRGNYSIEHRIRMTDGQFRWHLSRALPIISKSGELQRWFGTATDIHDLKVAEEKMLAAERRAAEEYYDMLSRIVPLAQSLGTARDLDTVYRGVLNFVQSSMPCSAFFVSFYDSELNLRLAAYAWGTGLGEIDVSKLPPLQLAEDGGPNSQAVFQRRPIIVNRYMDHMKNRIHVVVEEDGINPNSSMAVPMIVMDQVIGTLEVQAYENGVFTREHVIAIEMVANLAAVAIENVRLIETEAKARKEAEAANRMKDEFLSVLSHELRTPLNAMLGWVRMLRTGVLDKERTSKALEVIERNTRQQGSLIEDLLDVSRIISGRMRIEKDLADIVPIINVAAETVRPLALNKGLSLDVVADVEPLYLNGDAVRLQQVIINLLQNAVKFTPAGGEISLTLEKVDGTAVITVSDSGVGIESVFLPNIFDRFSQADASTRRNFTGLGLGLTIVRTIVELHDGEIHAESDGRDTGATFIVKLPLQEDFYRSSGYDPVVATSGGPAKLKGTTILLVDDDVESLQPIQIFLESQDAVVRCAGSVNDALAELGENDFDLLVSDIGMPAVDGYQFIELVRGSTAVRNSEIPAIALTAYASTDDREKAISAGFQHHLTKPVDFEILLAAIDVIRGRSQ